MNWNVRSNKLASQHIEVALVYKDMLGLDEAVRYLERERIARETVERVLFTDRRRPLPTMASSTELAPLPQVACRRRNLVQDAIVEAALKIQRKHGTERALLLLKEENVPQEVVERIIAEGPRQVRARKTEA